MPKTFAHGCSNTAQKTTHNFNQPPGRTPRRSALKTKPAKTMKTTTRKAIKGNELNELINKLTPGEYGGDYLPDGFTFETTPGHGYMCVDERILNSIPKQFHQTRFSRKGRYEEDCDWAIPVAYHLYLFDKRTQFQAISTIYNWHPDVFRDIFQLEPVDSYILLHPLNL